MTHVPSLAKVIDDAIQNQLNAVHTSLPAKVVRVDHTKGLVDVQPLLKKKYADETIVEMPVITNVPIGHYRAGNAFITLPIKANDTVLLIFSERSLDIWLNKGGVVDPLDARKFHLSDAVAYPGLYPFNNPPEGASETDIVIKNADAKILIKPDSIELYGSGDAVALASKVMTELNAIKTTFNAHTHPYMDSGSPAVSSPPSAPMSDPGQVKSEKVKAV